MEALEAWLYDDDPNSPMPPLHRLKNGPANQNPWRLLIIEDAEEFLNPKAKDIVGQALSRLLNVGDGFIGQGLNILVLMTTNVPLTDIHPAVKRPGRCMVNIEVPSMTRQQAEAWLEAPLPATLKEPTLAELYELQNKSHIGKDRQEWRGGQYL
jgi:SpoVK/Ycf46/Vps4 family AAA+-type ATPase